MLNFRSFLFLLSCGVGLNAAEIRGRVVDPSGGSVARATITVISRDGATRQVLNSDAGGNFLSNNIAAGNYLIEVRAEGFQSHTYTAETDEGSLELKLDVARVSSSVQVTAAGVAQSTDEAAKALDVLDTPQLEGRAEFSVLEALRLVPGLRVQQLGGPGSFARVQSRGMRSYDTAILVDGFRLRDAGSTQGDGSSLLGDLLLVDTDRIEVLRGSGASLYGTNASAAVLNLVTAAGGGALHGEVAAEGGGLGLVRGLAKAGGSALDQRLRFTGGVSHLNVTSGVDKQDRSRNSGGQGSAQFAAGPNTLLSGRVFASNIYLDLNDTPFAASTLPADLIIRAEPGRNYTPALNDPDQRRSGGFFTGMAGVTQQLSPRGSVRVTYQGVSTEREVRDGPGGQRFEPQFSNASSFDGRIDTVQARTDWQLASWQQVSAGYEWEREWFDNLSADDHPVAAQRVRARASASQHSHSVFAQDQLRLLGGRVLISLSGRLQDFQLKTPQFEGGLGAYQGIAPVSPKRALTGDVSVAYVARGSGTKLRAHAGNGYRAPSLYERFGTYFFDGFSALGDPRLRPERLISVDGGIDQYLFGNRVKARGTVFYTRIHEAIAFEQAGLITPATDPYGRFGGYWNTGGGLARGVELSVEAQPLRSTSVASSYTYTNADERVSALVGGSLRSPRIMTHMFTLTAAQRVGSRFDVTFDLFAGSNYVYAMSRRAFEFRGPRKADVAAGYTHPVSDRLSLKLFTRVENLLDRDFYEDGFRTPGRWATIGMKAVF